VLTGPDACYRIDRVPLGRSVVTARATGYRPVNFTVTVTEGPPATQDFVLAAEVLRLEEIVLTGSAADVRLRSARSMGFNTEEYRRIHENAGAARLLCSDEMVLNGFP
jgi:hypothetical protein